MANSKPGTVVALPRPKLLNAAAGNAEEAKPFRFAVTWETLFANLRAMEVADELPTAVVVAGPQEVVVAPPPVVVMPASEPLPQTREDEAAWEMVVPKMVRR
jgi:hypothetical protein